MRTLPMPCPACGTLADTTSANPWRPFCSKRCKLSDLGQWFAERYSIPAEKDSDAPAEPERSQ
jgi:uncharacterized protein